PAQVDRRCPVHGLLRWPQLLRHGCLAPGRDAPAGHDPAGRDHVAGLDPERAVGELVLGRLSPQGSRLLFVHHQLFLLMTRQKSRRDSMAFTSKKSCVAALLAAAFAVPAAAQQLTPMGAEQRANSASTIPAWDGGITKPPAGYTAGGHYADPFAADKPTLTIDGKNADQHAALLTPGQVAMLKKYPTYKMIVYPTRRSASFPQCHYNETKQCASSAKLAPGGNGVV